MRGTSGTVEPPLELRIRKAGLGVFHVPKMVGIEDAKRSQSFGKVVEASVELIFKEMASAVPLAFKNHRIAGSQLDADVGRAPPAATLRSG